MTNLFSPKMVGGMINSMGITEQDCASITYMFHYLDSELKYITFELYDDFTIEFNNGERLYAQVKINQFDIKFVSNLLSKYYDENKNQVFIGTGYDDKVRNLISLKERYKNSKIFKEKEEIKMEFEKECKKRNIDGNKFINVDFYIIDDINSIRIAKNEIYEWADRHKLFVDVQKVLETLDAKISLELRRYGGSLSYNEIIDIINQNKSSKIASLSDKKSYDLSKMRIIEEIEDKMRKHPREFDGLQSLKLKIENDLFIEAINGMATYYPEYGEYINIYLWLLNMNGKFNEVLSLKDEIKNENLEGRLQYIKALYELGFYTETIDEICAINNVEKNLELNMYLGMSYANTEDNDKARTVFEECISIDPEVSEPYIEMAKTYGYSKAALQYLNKAIKADKRNPKSYIEKGKIKRYFGSFEEAVSCFEQYMELSGDYYNEFVLREISFSCYNGNIEESKTYFSRWLDRMIKFSMLQVINGKIAGMDIGYNYTNIFCIIIGEKDVMLDVNNNYKVNIRRQSYSTGAIGLFVSPSNLFLEKAQNDFLRESQDVDDIIVKDEDTIIEEASMPALFKLFDNKDIYYQMKQILLKLNILIMNHEYEGYVEYLVNDEDIKVKIVKKQYSLDATIDIGGYCFDIWIPKTEDGYQAFMKKLSGKIMFNEAAVVLMCKEEICQITFNASLIEKFER